MNIKEIDAELVKSIAKLSRFLQAEKIDFNEFASNLIIRLVDYDYDNVEECLKQLVDDHLLRFLNYAKDYFKKNDFRPHPGVFMVDTNDPQNVESKREELKPKYEALMSHIEKAEKVLKKSNE
jgi:hypothetical protein